MRIEPHMEPMAAFRILEICLHPNISNHTRMVGLGDRDDEIHQAGRPIKVARARSTMMAVLECHGPSRATWRNLARAADAFMTVEDEDAVAAMERLAFPLRGDPAPVAGESGIGLAKVANQALREAVGLGPGKRVFLINTEGATDAALYEKLVGRASERI